MPPIASESMIADRSSRGCFWKRFDPPTRQSRRQLTTLQRLMGASLLVFLNKTDVEHCMSEQEVRQVCSECFSFFLFSLWLWT